MSTLQEGEWRQRQFSDDFSFFVLEWTAFVCFSAQVLRNVRGLVHSPSLWLCLWSVCWNAYWVLFSVMNGSFFLLVKGWGFVSYVGTEMVDGSVLRERHITAEAPKESNDGLTPTSWLFVKKRHQNTSMVYEHYIPTSIFSLLIQEYRHTSSISIYPRLPLLFMFHLF